MTERQDHAIEYLQSAAIEAIKAMRSFLDVAEGLVREPETATIVGKAFAEAAASAFRPPRAASEGAHGDEDPDAAPTTGGARAAEETAGVRRIDLSD
jgi:hypothetical protein